VSPPRIVLASSSPRRREILSALGLTFETRPSDVDESLKGGEGAFEAAERLAREKAAAVAAGTPDALVVAADTLVVLDGEALGKPKDRAEAGRTLARLAGRTHEVVTGVALARDGRLVSGREITRVHFAPMSPAEVEAYVASAGPGRTRSRGSAGSSSTGWRAARRTSSASPCGCSTRSRPKWGST
jgi:septum formation protein